MMIRGGIKQMNAVAILRSTQPNGIEDQFKRISQYGQTENINVCHTAVIESDEDLDSISFQDMDAVIVVNESRITRNHETFKAFKQKLDDNNVQLIVLSGEILNF